MNQIALRDPRLKPALPGEITEHLHQLFSNLPQKGGDDPVTVMNGYAIALQGLPEWAIGNAVRAFLRGMVPGQDKRFCPRAPELSAAARKELDHVYEDVAKKRREESFRSNDAYRPRPVRIEPPRGPIVARNVGHNEWLNGARTGVYGLGCSWVARTGCVHGPLEKLP